MEENILTNIFKDKTEEEIEEMFRKVREILGVKNTKEYSINNEKSNNNLKNNTPIKKVSNNKLNNRPNNSIKFYNNKPNNKQNSKPNNKPNNGINNRNNNATTNANRRNLIPQKPVQTFLSPKRTVEDSLYRAAESGSEDDLLFIKNHLETKKIPLQPKTIIKLASIAIKKNNSKLLGILLSDERFVRVLNNPEPSTENPIFLVNFKSSNAMSIIKLLVENGIDINQKNKDGKTFLEQALIDGVPNKIILSLIRNGADVTPYSLSLVKGRSRILSVLTKYADTDIITESLVEKGLNIVDLLKNLCANGENDKFIEIYNKNKLTNNNTILLL